MKFLLILFITSVSITIGFAQAPKKNEMVSVNGTNIYYEVYGKGVPLFLLHGFTQSSKSWHPFVDDYANEFEVYLIDLKGHGKSGQFTEKLSIRDAAKDLDALIRHLKLDSINAIGFSYGGDILFQLALLRPGLIKSMISIGACGSWDAKDFPQWVEYLSYKNIDNLPWMKEQQTNEAQIRAILEQMPNYIVSVSDQEMKSIRARTLFVFGDQDDSIPLSDIGKARQLLPNSFLWILPNTGHSAHKDKNKNEFVKVSKQFINNTWSQ
jgi:pimeloyl-ACP methyl ester carboxylesterase